MPQRINPYRVMRRASANKKAFVFESFDRHEAIDYCRRAQRTDDQAFYSVEFQARRYRPIPYMPLPMPDC